MTEQTRQTPAPAASHKPVKPVAWRRRRRGTIGEGGWIMCPEKPPSDREFELQALFTETPTQRVVKQEDDWRDDPSADERWNAGLDYGMVQLCSVLGVDPHMVNWDAATETLDGDVCAAICNIFRTKYGDDFDPTSSAAPTTQPLTDETRYQRPEET